MVCPSALAAPTTPPVQSEPSEQAAGNPEFNHTAAERDTFIAEETADYVHEGPPISGRLEAFSPVPIKLRRGKCYRMIVRLEPGASFSLHARKGLSFQSKIGEEVTDGGPGVYGPGGVGSLGCPQKNGNGQFDLRAIWNSANGTAHIHDLGTGPFTMQLVSKPIDEKALREQAADREIQSACSECWQRRSQCEREKVAPHSIGRSCVTEYMSCLKQRKLDFSACK